jgi:tetratricopeptide (TPR) repeat protein
MINQRASLRLHQMLAALALVLAGVPTSAAGQDTAAIVVQSITVDGRGVTTAEGILLTAPGRSTAERRTLKENDTLSPGTIIDIPERTVVRLRTSNLTEVTLQPGSRTKINAVSENGESFTQHLGEAWFRVVRSLNFFEVTHGSFLAAVKGTEFKVSVDQRNIQFEWLEGHIDISRDVRVKVEGTEQADPVTMTEEVSAEKQRVRYQVNAAEYLQDFKTYKDVEDYFRRELTEDEQSGDDERVVLGLNNLGTALVMIGKASDAIAYYTRALGVHRQLHPSGLHPSIATDYSKLGVAYGEAGDPQRAIEAYRESLGLLQQLYPDGLHPQIAINYTNLGVEYGKLKDSRTAIDFYQQSLALLPRLYDPNSAASKLATAANLGNLGVEYGKLNERQRARDTFERALALHRELYPDGVHPDIAVDYLNIGVQDLYLGDVPAAIERYDLALAVLLQIFPDGTHPFIAQAYRNLESAWRSRGDAARADEYARKLQETEGKLRR